MQRTEKIRRILLIGVFIICAAYAAAGFAQEAAEVKPYVDQVEQTKQGMTLWETLKSGGVIMIFLGLMSAAMFALIGYIYLRLKPVNMVPEEFSSHIIERLHLRRYDVVRTLCEENESLISVIVLEGLKRIEEGAVVCRQTIEISARREIDRLWSVLGYLNDVAHLAPMLGLLGTVLGMMQAFNTIAFGTTVVKPILLAAGVSKAMITTAGGMAVAIIAIAFHSLLRVRLLRAGGSLEVALVQVLETFKDSGEEK